MSGGYRAAVLIGVEKTGNLPTLQAVRKGVEDMRRWLSSQPGMKQPPEVLTDAGGGPVTVKAVKDRIKTLVDLGTIEQLFVYFAGHGVNIRYNEYWLLSGAPDDPDEAVNVTESISLARQCGIPHVVLISDACRTAADSIQAQAVEGSLIFPNAGPREVAACVDIFYASGVGRPAYEVKDALAAAGGFQAVYTTALVHGLDGSRSDLVVPEDAEAGSRIGRIRPWPLKRYLQAEVPRLLLQLGRDLTKSQTPDAVITSAPEAWLSELALAPATGPVRRTRSARRPGGGRPESGEPSPAEAPETLVSVAQTALRAALQGRDTPSSVLRTAATVKGGTLFRDTLNRSRSAPGPGHYETKCGFKVHGTIVADAVTGGARVDMLDGPKGLVRIAGARHPAANVLLVFKDGRGALLPAIPSFIATLAYEEDELAEVTYEPSDNSTRWQELQGQLGELRELRSIIASSARVGAFRLEGKEDAEALIDRMRAAKGVDPAMAVYAAHALHQIQQRKSIESVQRYLRQDLGLSLFDVALLALPAGAAEGPMPADVFPAVPLLSQAWALLRSRGVMLPPGLQGIQRHVTDSLWTMFDREGVAAVRKAIESGEVI